MNHHVNGLTRCPLCEEKLSTAHPDLAEWYRTRVKINFPQMHISDAWRGKEEQERAFACKKSILHFPFGAHNKMDEQGNPCSLALDLFELISGHATYPVNVFHKIQELIDEFDDPIFWGGRWEKLGDFCHFQLELSGASTPVMMKQPA